MSEMEEVLKFKSLKSGVPNEAEERKRRRELDDLEWVLSDKRGRRFVYRLLYLCNMFHHVFRGSEYLDAMESGKRFIGMTLQRDIEEAVGFQILDLMRKEDRILKEQEGRLE